jgi:hypothetical protein
MNKVDLECKKSIEGVCCIKGEEIETCSLFKAGNIWVINDNGLSVRGLCNCGNNFIFKLDELKTKCNLCNKRVNVKLLEDYEKFIAFEVFRIFKNHSCMYVFCKDIYNLKLVRDFGINYMSDIFRFEEIESYLLLSRNDICNKCGFCNKCNKHVKEIVLKSDYMFCKICGENIKPNIWKRNNIRKCPNCKSDNIKQLYNRLLGFRIDKR